MFPIIELAARYVKDGGTDTRAARLVEAGKKAGFVNSKGEYVGPTERVGALQNNPLLAEVSWENTFSRIDEILSAERPQH